MIMPSVMTTRIAPAIPTTSAPNTMLLAPLTNSVAILLGPKAGKNTSAQAHDDEQGEDLSQVPAVFEYAVDQDAEADQHLQQDQIISLFVRSCRLSRSSFWSLSAFSSSTTWDRVGSALTFLA